MIWKAKNVELYNQWLLLIILSVDSGLSNWIFTVTLKELTIIKVE